MPVAKYLEGLLQHRLVEFIPVVEIVQVHGVFAPAEASSANLFAPRMPLRGVVVVDVAP